MKLYGDLLRFLAKYLSKRVKFVIIRVNRLIRSLCLKNYFIKIFDNFFEHKSFINIPFKLQKFISKIEIANQDLLLPQHITHLKLDKYFNDLSKLPQKLIYLKLGKNYDKPLKGLPNSNLIYLKVGYNFNQPIDDLPSKFIISTFKK